MRIASLASLATISVVALSAPALAEIELNFYTGIQSAPHSNVSGNDPGGVGAFDFNAGWDGRSFETPAYYGFRVTFWQDNGPRGYGIDFTHAKIYADDETLDQSGFDRLEFTDGLNFLTGNIYHRFQNEDRRWTPFVGAGAGIAIPHIDVSSDANRTFEYQYVGPTVQLTAGVSYELSPRWSVFGEYKGNYTKISADLDGGGTLETDVITNALNVGLGLRF